MAGFMPIGEFRVVYVDGHTEECVSNFLGLVEIERRWPGEETAPGVTAVAVAVFYYLGCPGDDLDKWLATVHNVEPIDKDAKTDVPTSPAVGAA
jgi:hypothetical protein